MDNNAPYMNQLHMHGELYESVNSDSTFSVIPDNVYCWCSLVNLIESACLEIAQPLTQLAYASIPH